MGSDKEISDMEIEREQDALAEFNDLLAKFNDPEVYAEADHIEQGMLFYLVMRMSAMANQETGEEFYPEKLLSALVKAAIKDGKELVAVARREGQLPTHVKILTPRIIQ